MNETKLTPGERRQLALNRLSRLVAADQADYSHAGQIEAVVPIRTSIRTGVYSSVGRTVLLEEGKRVFCRPNNKA